MDFNEFKKQILEKPVSSTPLHLQEYNEKFYSSLLQITKLEVLAILEEYHSIFNTKQ